MEKATTFIGVAFSFEEIPIHKIFGPSGTQVCQIEISLLEKIGSTHFYRMGYTPFSDFTARYKSAIVGFCGQLFN